MGDKAIQLQKTKRRFRIPPAPRWRVESGAPDGLALLADFEGPAWRGREDVGVALWMAVRAVQLWTLTPSFGRLGLAEEPRVVSAERFTEAREEVAELADAWDAFSRLVTAADQVDGRALAVACHDVYAWAERRSLIRTAARFAELAAFLDEDDPALAEDAGWAARRAGYHDRAEEWHQRAFALAVQKRNRRQAVRALIGYGTLQMELGRTDAARVMFEKAVNRAMRTGKRRLAAQAQRYRFMLEAEVGSYEDALEHARRALALCTVHDAGLPTLLHNLGCTLIRHRLFTAAYLLLNRLPDVLERPSEQAVSWASTAWAAAGAGRREVYADAERRATELAGTVEEGVPAAWYQLAEGARCAGDPARARRFAERGRALALMNRDVLVLAYSERLIADLEASRPPLREVAPPDSDALSDLLSRALSQLRRWGTPGAGPTTGRLL